MSASSAFLYGCVIDGDSPAPPIDHYDTDMISGGGGSSQTGVDSSGGADSGADSGSSGGQLCDPSMAQFDCFGLAEMTYCRDDNGSICTTFPISGPGKEAPLVGCIGPDATTDGIHIGLTIPGQCGTWAGDDYDYQNAEDPIVAEILERCQSACEIDLAGGFGPLSVVDAAGDHWSAQSPTCYIYGGTWSSGVNGPELSEAFDECMYDVESGLPGPAVQRDPIDQTIIACSTDSCATASCTAYDEAVAQAGNATNTSLRKITAWIPIAQAEVIRDTPADMFCSHGRYIWSSTTTNSRFDGLGVGDLFYTLGFRNGDRILSMWRFNPANGQQIGSTYAIDTPIDLFDAYDGLMTSAGNKYVAIKIRRGRVDWTMFVAAS